jgi:PAS domain S-box-containing protein
MRPSLVIALTSGAESLVAVSLGQRILGALLALSGLAVVALRRRRQREAEMSGRERDNGIVRAILGSSPSICYAVDPSGHVIFANRAFESALALREDGALGRPLAECLSLGPGDTFALANDLACSAAAAIEVVETLHVEGERRTYVSTKFVLRDETSRPYAVCSISSDATPRVRAEEALFQSQKLEGIGRLAGGVAHDFNNVLAVIIGQSELLAKKIGPDGPAARRVAEIHRAASQGANLTRQLLAFSRKEALEPKVLGSTPWSATSRRCCAA